MRFGKCGLGLNSKCCHDNFLSCHYDQTIQTPGDFLTVAREIASGRYGAGPRLPSEPQLVKKCGVSRPTVERTLLDSDNEGLIERGAGSGTYSILHPAARQARRGKKLLLEVRQEKLGCSKGESPSRLMQASVFRTKEMNGKV